MMTTRNHLIGLAVLACLAVTGCQQDDDDGGSGGNRATGIAPEWFETLHEEVDDYGPSIAEIPELKLDEDCELTDELPIAGDTTDEQNGSGVSTLGETGERYVCSFREPPTDLVVVQYDDADELARTVEAAHAQQQAGNEQTEETVTVGERDILVVRTTYPTNDSHIDYSATYVDEENKGIVLLDVETTDELMDAYSVEQAAKDLAELLENS